MADEKKLEDLSIEELTQKYNINCARIGDNATKIVQCQAMNNKILEENAHLTELAAAKSKPQAAPEAK